MPPKQQHRAAVAAGRVPVRRLVVLCALSFLLGFLFSNRAWSIFGNQDGDVILRGTNWSHVADNCESQGGLKDAPNFPSQVSQTNDAIMNLDKRISDLEMRLMTVRAEKVSNQIKPWVDSESNHTHKHQRVFLVMGIITALCSRRRRDLIRKTWMPQGESLKRLEREKGIVVRFVVGHSENVSNASDQTFVEEHEHHQDLLILNYDEAYEKPSSKTLVYFSTAITSWDADFYAKVSDDVHVNIGVLASILTRYKSKPGLYIGCMKSGPVVSKKDANYHEPEHWKFGTDGNNYFRHATGQLYVLSRDLVTYISVHRHMLHKFVNEDVMVGSWLIGLNVEHIDERSLCCGTPPDCESKVQTARPCAASFDWNCSGICNYTERIEEVHRRCGKPIGTTLASRYLNNTTGE